MKRMDKFILLLVVMVLAGVAGRAQAPVDLSKVDNGKVSAPGKAEDKKPALPAEVTIPEARVDKTKVLILERALLLSELEKLELKYKELKASKEEKEAKLFAEFTSALKAAGVADENHEKYTIDLATLKLVKKEDPLTKK